MNTESAFDEPSDDGGSARSPFTVLPSASRNQQIRGQLEGLIESGELGPGDRLPSERELSELLGVSRVSVREAIRSLEAVGLVEVHHGRGTFVVESRSGRYAISFGQWLSVHRDEVLELLQVRGALDELAAECAARRDDGDVGRLRAFNAEFRAAGHRDDLTALVACDVAFHDAIADASGSRLLVRLLHELHEVLNESRHATLAPPGRPKASAQEHDAIVAAIAAHDPSSARAAVAEHLSSVRESLTRAAANTTETSA